MIADALYVGDTSVDRVMLGDVEVWSSAPVVPDLPVVTITGTIGYESREQFLQACIDHGTTFDTVEVLPFRLDTSQATNIQYMFDRCSSLTSVPDMDTSQATAMSYTFRDCSSLTSVPDMDTSQVTDMRNTFQGCSALTSAPDMDTSNVTRMANMFRSCTHLTHVPDLATSNVTSMNSMFLDCSSLTDGNVRLIGRHPNVSTIDMILNSGLTREPFYDTNGNPI